MTEENVFKMGLLKIRTAIFGTENLEKKRLLRWIISFQVIRSGILKHAVLTIKYISTYMETLKLFLDARRQLDSVQ